MTHEHPKLALRTLQILQLNIVMLKIHVKLNSNLWNFNEDKHVKTDFC